MAKNVPALLIAALVAISPMRAASAETQPAGPLPVAQDDVVELEFWQTIRSSNDPAEYEAYLQVYPKGKFSILARVRLKRLRAEGAEAGTTVQSESPDVDIQPTKAQEPNSALPIPQEETFSVKLAAAPSNPSSAFFGITDMVTIPRDAELLSPPIPSDAVLVLNTPSGSPIRKAGISAGSMIVSIDDHPITSVDRLLEQADRYVPGDVVTVKVMKLAGSRAELLALIQGRVDSSNEKAFSKYLLARVYEKEEPGDQYSKKVLDLLDAAAAEGCAQAEAYLGHKYYNGIGTEIDYSRALDWYRKAAEHRQADAMYSLGFMSQHGLGVPKNTKKAVHWFSKAGELGHSGAALQAGYLIGVGDGVKGDQEIAVYWYQKSAELGNATGMLNLGRRYQTGKGVRKNMALAARWYEKAAELGHLDGLSGLAFMYKFGHGGRAKDLPKAVSLLRRAADRGNASGYYNLGLMYEDGLGVFKDRAEALRLYRLAAEGDSRAEKRIRSLGATVYDPAEIQRLLSQLGFDPGKIDGQIGGKTKRAISSYQQKAGLDPTGLPSLALVKSLRGAKKTARAPSPTQTASTSKQSDTKPTGSKNDILDLSDLDTLD